MSKRSRERKLRALAERQAIQNEIKDRAYQRGEPIRKYVRRVIYTVFGTAIIFFAAWGGVAGTKYLISGQLSKVSGPFGTIEKTDLAASKNILLKTNFGDITLQLDTQNTPKTAANFVLLTRAGFYDGTKFHRVIKDFMIQGGDPNSKNSDPSDDGTGGPGYSFADEPIKGDYTRGVLAMANSGANTNGSQFFIMQKDTTLPKNYVIFGKVTSGMDVVDAIANTPVKDNGQGEMSRPIKDVIIESATIL